MTTLIINDHEVKTNWKPGRGSFPVCDGNGRDGWTMCLVQFGESVDEALHRLGKHYNRVSFYEVTTCVKGYHKTIAFCKWAH